MNYDQQVEKERKLKEFLEEFRSVKNEVSSINDLVKRLGSGYSRSTIQRYFHEVFDRKMVNIEEYKEIKKWLENSKKQGLSTGGKTTQEKHGYRKDEKGHFIGSKR